MPTAKGLRTTESRAPSSRSASPASQYWPIKDIVDERVGRRGREYQVVWVGIDPSSGKAWPREWILEKDANEAATLAWNRQKIRTAPLRSPSVSDEKAIAARPPTTWPSPGVQVRVPSPGHLFREENYPTCAISASQVSQTSTAASRDTASWHEESQQSWNGASQLLPSSSQPSLVLQAPDDVQSSSIPSLYSDSRHKLSNGRPASVLQSSSEPRQRVIVHPSSSEVSSISDPVDASRPTPQSAQLAAERDRDTISELHTQTAGSPLPARLATGSGASDPCSISSILNNQEQPLVADSAPERALYSGKDLSVKDLGVETQTSSNWSSNQGDQRSSGHISSEAGTQAAQSQSAPFLTRENNVPTSQDASVYSNVPDVFRPTRVLFETETLKTDTSSLPERSVQHRFNMSTLNGGRVPSDPSPPMQDRVRSIRNSALSYQPRRLASDDQSPASSRATSLAPEAKKTPDVQQDPRPLENVVSYQFSDMFPEDSDDPDLPSSKFELSLPANGDNMEFFFALPLPSRVKSQYDATIKYFKKAMKAFLSDNVDAATTHNMRRLVQRLNNVSIHVDLENEEWEKSQEEPTEDQVKWALSSGSKFVFLHSLCSFLRDQNKSIAVVSGEPRVLHLLEQFMHGLQIDYVRPSSGKRSLPASSQSALKVSLIGTGPDAQIGPWSPADLVIAFDGTFSAEERHVRTLRSNPTSPGGLAPVVHPLVFCSAEHLSMCIESLDTLKTEHDKLRALILAIDERQPEIGEMLPEDARADAAGEEVGYFVQHGGSKEAWTLLPVRPVKVPGLEVIVSDELSPAPDMEAPIFAASNARKRPSEDELGDEPEGLKRQRMSPITEQTHVSESTAASQIAQIAELQTALASAQEALRAAEQSASLRLGKMEAMLGEREQSLTDQGKALDDLQSRYEKSKRAYRKIQAEKADAAEQLAAAERRREALAATNDQLREDLRNRMAELEEARAELANSAVPEVAQLEQLRQENRTLASDKEALERKASSVARDFEFTRQEYQKASSAAAEHYGKVEELEQENAALRQKASGEAARLREMTNRKEVELHLGENARLRAEVEELKEQLKRKERGRGMTTRTGSAAPRSPRLGASPGRSRAGSRAPGSRPQSPVRSFYAPRRGRGLVESL